MKPRHQVSRAAIELIKRFEGYRHRAAQLADGRWTIGYGHTLTAREGAEVSEADAEALLLYDLIAVAHAVNELTYTPLTQNQFDSLCCFAFNVGLENFRGSSVLRRVNEGALLQAACAMEMWRKADFEGERIVIDALVRRRSAEKTLFLTPAGGWVPAPSPVLRPKVDYDVQANLPRETPTALVTPLVGERAVAERESTPAPVPVEPPVTPTASETAAALVGARLEQILPDEPVEEAAPVPPPAPAPVAEPLEVPPFPPALVEDHPPAPEFQLTPAVEVEREPQPEPRMEVIEVAPSEPGLFETHMPDYLEDDVPALGMANADLSRRIVSDDDDDHVVSVFDIDGPDNSATGRSGGLTLLVLALVGIAMFAGASYWGVSAQGDVAKTVGWGLAILGVLMIGSAVWLFLNKLGASAEEDEDAGA